MNETTMKTYQNINQWTKHQDATPEIKEKLAYLEREVDAESISQEELLELQGLVDYINPADTHLLEAAGVPEFNEEED